MSSGSSDHSGSGGPARPLVPADLDRRFYAYVLDRALGWGLAAGAGALTWFVLDERDWRAVAGATLGALLAIGLALAVLRGTRGTTPGGSALGLRTVAVTTGGPAGVTSCVRRGLLVGLAGLPTAGLGVATLAWTAAADPSGHRRGWHDRRCGTEVVDVRPAPAPEAAAEPVPAALVNLTALRLVPAPTPPAARSAESPPAGVPDDVPPPGVPDDVPPPGVPDDVASPGVSDDSPAEAVVPTSEAVEAPNRPDPSPADPPSAPRPPRQLGAPLTRVTAGSAPLEAEPDRVSPDVRWRVTFDSGETLLVQGPLLVGRGPQPRAGEAIRHLVPLRSADMSLSKTHAEVHVARDGALVVTDRGSTNGSMIVRRGMSRELPAGRPSTLVDGDRVRFGDREMRVSREA